MKPSPADHRAADLHERLVHLGAFVEPRAQAAELVQQRDRLLDDVPEDSQAAAVFFPAAGDRGGDAARGTTASCGEPRCRKHGRP